MTDKAPLLGILGGLGPMSTIYFCELLNRHTLASCDADHIDMIISSRATTPDRTAYILGRSTQDPLPVMIEEAHRLEGAGADLIVIPCNTAHYFYDGLTKECHVPVLNIITKTIEHLKTMGIERFGLLATEGTVSSGAYHRLCTPLGLQCISPSQEDQKIISSIIYDSIKQNKPVDMSAFLEVAERLLLRGCQRLVLGCTELSLLKEKLPSTLPITDSLEVLAYHTVKACNKTPTAFSPSFFGGDA